MVVQLLKELFLSQSQKQEVMDLLDLMAYGQSKDIYFMRKQQQGRQQHQAEIPIHLVQE